MRYPALVAAAPLECEVKLDPENRAVAEPLLDARESCRVACKHLLEMAS
jgi:hypothetical protein